MSLGHRRARLRPERLLAALPRSVYAALAVSPRSLAPLLALLFTGCVLPELSLEGKACPCVAGFVCDELQGVCVPDGSLVPRDGGAGDAAGDGGEITDSGEDVDGGGPDGGLEDAGEHPDAEALDAGDGGATDGPLADGGHDAGPADAGFRPCTWDLDCDPPRLVCGGGNQCVAGCGHGGAACTGGATCDPASGRCSRVGAPCATAADCGDPTTHACAFGQCRFGCGVATAACTMDRFCEEDGFCAVAPSCTLDEHCEHRDFRCVNGSCIRRCELPGAAPCLGDSSCDPQSGRCMPGSPLGANCAADEQCTSGLCLVLTSPTMQTFCSRACGATSDCPLGSTCVQVSGAKLCVRGSAFSPPLALSTPSGDGCANPGNTCHSAICAAGAPGECVERCGRRADCAAFGTPCVLVETSGAGGVTFTQRCIPAGAGAATGATCMSNTVCANGLCDEYNRRCAEPCCSDADCGASESCLIYDLPARSPTPSTAITICQPRPGATGNLLFGQSCTQDSQCDAEVCRPVNPRNLGGPRACTTHCCTDRDCDVLPNGGRCVPMPVQNLPNISANVCVPR